jgi:hypothetical protein
MVVTRHLLYDPFKKEGATLLVALIQGVIITINDEVRGINC